MGTYSQEDEKSFSLDLYKDWILDELLGFTISIEFPKVLINLYPLEDVTVLCTAASRNKSN